MDRGEVTGKDVFSLLFFITIIIIIIFVLLFPLSLFFFLPTRRRKQRIFRHRFVIVDWDLDDDDDG